MEQDRVLTDNEQQALPVDPPLGLDAAETID